MTKLMNMGTLGLAAIATFASAPAFAAGTTAGSSITNTATVDFQVGGVSQVRQSASDTFVVDRKINLLVEEVGTVTTNVVPGQTNAVTTFQVINLSNEGLDFLLAANVPAYRDAVVQTEQEHKDAMADDLGDLRHQCALQAAFDVAHKLCAFANTGKPRPL